MSSIKYGNILTKRLDLKVGVRQWDGLKEGFKLGSWFWGYKYCNFLQRHGFIKVWIAKKGWGYSESTFDLGLGIQIW